MKSTSGFARISRNQKTGCKWLKRRNVVSMLLCVGKKCFRDARRRDGPHLSMFKLLA